MKEIYWRLPNTQEHCLNQEVSELQTVGAQGSACRETMHLQLLSLFTRHSLIFGHCQTAYWLGWTEMRSHIPISCRLGFHHLLFSKSVAYCCQPLLLKLCSSLTIGYMTLMGCIVTTVQFKVFYRPIQKPQSEN